MEKAIIYARVSTEDQVDGASLDNQVKACRDYCADKGYTVLAEFREDVSGAEVNRQELDKIIEIADSFDVLTVYSVDRFAREMEVHYILEKEIKAKGARVEFAIGGFSDTPEGQLYKNMTMAFAQFERTIILRRTVSGLQARARSGKVTHAQTPPYGYDYKDGYFTISEDQAKVIQQIFKWYTVHKFGGAKIAKMLTDQGVPTSWDIHGYQKKTKGWGTSSIMKILKNPVYYGEFSFGDIIIDVPPIIDKKLFLKAERQRKENQHFAKRNTKNGYLLQGRLYCAVCGGQMFGVTHNRKGGYVSRYYRCNGELADKNSGEAVCRGKALVKPIDERAWAFIEDVIINTEGYLELWRKRQRSGDYESTENTIKKNKAEIELLEARRAKLIPLYLDDKYTKDELDTYTKEINERIAELRDNIRILEDLPGMSIFDLKENEFIEVWRDRVGQLDFEQRQQTLAILNVKAYAVRLGKGEVLLQIEGDYEGLPLYYCD